MMMERPFFGILTRSIVPIGIVMLLDDVELCLTPAGIGYGLFRHAMGDWGEVEDESWRLNDEALSQGGPVASLFTSPPSNIFFRIGTEGDRRNTFVLLDSNYPAFEAGRIRRDPAA